MDAKMPIDRRALIGAGLAGAASACAPCPEFVPMPKNGRADMGDAHTHLFNAADLPIAGFMRDVLAPKYLEGAPRVVLSLIDIALVVLKGLSISADRELGRLVPPWRAEREDDVPAERFADAVADLIESRIAAKGSLKSAERTPLSDTADSHYALAQLIGASGGSGVKAATADVGRVDRAALARIAREGAAAEPPGAMKAVAATADQPADTLDARRIWAIIKWSFLMVQSRCSHLHKYLGFAEAGGKARVTLLINLLVDYDAWLADAPKKGSLHASQVAFWTHYSRAVSKRVRIETFAGFDPLKLAEERVSGGSTRYLETLKGWFAARGSPDAPAAVSGFKVYPSMGFQVFGNRGRIPHRDRAAARVYQRWHDKWPGRDLDTELDRSLDDFFDFCVEADAPVMTHARDSNNASTGAEEDGSLEHWGQRARDLRKRKPHAAPLRACLGHFSWWWPGYNRWMAKLLDLNAAGDAQFYFDIGYAEHFLRGEGDVVLENMYLLANGDGKDRKPEKYMMFGSDWIMLAQEPDAARYFDAAIAAVREHHFWKHHEDALFGGNLRKFLKLPASVAALPGSALRACPSRLG